MEELRAAEQEPVERQQLIDMLVGVVDQAVNRHRARYIAVFELALESMRRPSLATAFTALWSDAVDVLREVHHRDDHDPTLVQANTLNAIYNGVLFLRLVRPASLTDGQWDDVTRSGLEAVLPR